MPHGARLWTGPGERRTGSAERNAVNPSDSADLAGKAAQVRDFGVQTPLLLDASRYENQAKLIGNEAGSLECQSHLKY